MRNVWLAGAGQEEHIRLGWRIAIIWRVLLRLGGLGLATMALLAIGGCGSSTPPPKLTVTQAAQLRQDLASVRTAVSAHDRARAQSSLDRLSRLVTQDAASGNVSGQNLQLLRTAISQVRQRIVSELPAPPTAPATTSPAPQPPAGPAAPKHKGHPKGHDHGKGPH